MTNNDKKIQVQVLAALRSREVCKIDVGGGLQLVKATTRISDLAQLVHDNGGAFGMRLDSTFNWLLLIQPDNPREYNDHELRVVRGDWAIYSIAKQGFYEVVVLRFRSQSGEITPEKRERMFAVLGLVEPAARTALSKRITAAQEQNER